MGQDYHLDTDHLSSSHKKKWLSASGKQRWEWHVTAIKYFGNAEMYHIIILSSVIPLQLWHFLCYLSSSDICQMGG